MSQILNLVDDDYAVDKTYEPRTLDEKSSSDESDEQKQKNNCTGKTFLDHPLLSMSLELIHCIVLSVANS
ncbi:hypothetical protein TNCV_4801331 [Trichonephila clavipes]|nr:hypothetical protein TNCV_4801331 [Trichonephila clavipes]